MKYDLKSLCKEKSFIDFYSYREDKWLQNAELEEKLIAVFGNIENAINEYKNDCIFKKNN